MKKEFNDWLMLLPWDNEKCSCPACGVQSIDYRVIGDIDKGLGWALVWCASCKIGIHVSRMELPENAKVVSFKEAENSSSLFPDYQINMVQP